MGLYVHLDMREGMGLYVDLDMREGTWVNDF